MDRYDSCLKTESFRRNNDGYSAVGSTFKEDEP